MFDFFVSEILNKIGVNKPNLLDRVFCFSKMLSSDVDAGYDPIYASVSDRENAGFLGKGISLNKYPCIKQLSRNFKEIRCIDW